MSCLPWSGRRVLGLFPHPDDEAYAAGGTLALCARRGATVTIGCATRGEHGTDRANRTPPGDALGAIRVAELGASCRAVGAAPPLLFDLPDGALAGTDRYAVAARVADIVARIAPHVIITLGRDGVYGSADHVAWTHIVRTALGGAGAEGETRVLHTAFPRGLFEPVRRALRRAGNRALITPEPEALGADPVDIDLRIPLDEVRDRKIAAVAAHRSQLEGGDPRSFLRPGLLDALLAEEWFTLEAGPLLPRAATDPFAGL
jgi:LmbE family N-acetylglucosaminyl deacetylase